MRGGVLALLAATAVGECDFQTYKVAVTDCDEGKQRCIEDLTGSGKGTARRDVLCNGSVCQAFLGCIQQKQASTGCTASLSDPIGRLQSMCTSMTNQCMEQANHKCDNTTSMTPQQKNSGFSWITACSNFDEAAMTAAQPQGFPHTINSAVVSVLPQSKTNQLLTLLQITHPPVCSATAVARSYDGHAWEGLMPTPLQPKCDAVNKKCSFSAPDSVNASYRVDATVILALETRRSISRLLRQATFGPTLSTINSFATTYGTGPESVIKWIDHQKGLPPTSLRSYYRQRVNPPYRKCQEGGYSSCGEDEEYISRIRKPCELGSRWDRFAFSHADWGAKASSLEGRRKQPHGFAHWGDRAYRNQCF